MTTQTEATRTGLVAIKTLLSRDPCVHATTAIQMIDAILAEQPAPEQYQRIERGEGDWMDCTKEQYEKAMALPEWDTRVIATPPAPAQEPVAWKLMPKEPTDEMLKAMDECSTEGYDERLYAGHAASVYMAAVDVAPAPPQRKPLTDDKYEAIVEDLADWGRYVEVDTAHQSLEKHVREVLTAHGITKGNT